MAEVALGQADSGRTAETTPGGRIVVQLPENPTTGYSWQLEPVKDDVVRLERDVFQTPSDAPGAGGVRVFIFLAQSPGTALLCLRLKRAMGT